MDRPGRRLQLREARLEGGHPRLQRLHPVHPWRRNCCRRRRARSPRRWARCRQRRARCRRRWARSPRRWALGRRRSRRRRSRCAVAGSSADVVVARHRWGPGRGCEASTPRPGRIHAPRQRLAVAIRSLHADRSADVAPRSPRVVSDRTWTNPPLAPPRTHSTRTLQRAHSTESDSTMQCARATRGTPRIQRPAPPPRRDRRDSPTTSGARATPSRRASRAGPATESPRVRRGGARGR